MTPITVSVVIPARNAGPTIRFQLEALTRQTYRGAWEVIVVDNQSADDTASVARSFEARLPNLAVVSATELGIAPARWAGVCKAVGEYVALCDADDEVDDDWLRAMAGECRPNRIVVSRFDEETLNDPVVRSWIPAPHTTSELIPHLGFKPYARGAGLALPRSLCIQLGGWDNTMVLGEDVEFSWRALREGVELVQATDAIVRYRFRAKLSDVMRQARKAGISDADLYRRFRTAGMPRPPAQRTLRAYGSLLARLPSLLNLQGRGQWMRAAAYRWGRLIGSWRYRVLFL